MGSLRGIRKRTRAVGSIRTIMRTMEMVATARFKQMHDRAVAARPYIDRLSELIGDMVARCDGEKLEHPLLAPADESKPDVLLLITSNRGLCGSYNHGVFRLALERLGQVIEAGLQAEVHVVGKRGLRTLRARGFHVDRAYTGWDSIPSYEQVGELTDRFVEQFLEGRIAGLEIAYTQFVSSETQSPAIAQVLPLGVLEAPRRRLPIAGEPAPYEFMPSVKAVVNELLPKVVPMRIYQCFMDSAASEQMMRIKSMRLATENADEMLRDLRMRYNRLRQTEITKELAEIVGGRGSAASM